MGAGPTRAGDREDAEESRAGEEAEARDDQRAAQFPNYQRGAMIRVALIAQGAMQILKLPTEERGADERGDEGENRDRPGERRTGENARPAKHGGRSGGAEEQRRAKEFGGRQLAAPENAARIHIDHC